MTVPIRPAIALWLTLLLPGNLVASPILAQNPAFDRPADTIADLAVKLAATNNRQQALQLFDRSVSVALAVKDRAERRTALVAVAAKMGTVGEKERAFTVLEQAVKLVPEEDYLVLSAIAVDMAKLGKTQRALQLFNRAVKLHQKIAKKDYPTQDSYFKDGQLVEIVINIAQAGQIKRALQITRTLPSPLSRAEAFNGIATTLIATGNIDSAKAPLSQALQIASKIADEDVRYTYLSNGSCGNQKFDLLVKVGQNLSLMAQFDQALKVATKIYGCGSANGESTQDYQVWAFTGILTHFTKIEQVKQTWNSASKITSNLEKAKIWSAIAIKLVEIGEIDLAFNIAEKIADKVPSGLTLDPPYTSGSKEPELTAIAFKLAEVGATPKSQELVERIDKAFRSEVKALIAIPVAKKLYQQGQSDAANTLLAQSLQLPQITPDPQRGYDDYKLSQTRSIREKIAIELAKIGQIDRALTITQSIREEYWEPNTLAQIASALAETGDVESAFKLAPKIRTSVDLVNFIKTIAPKLTTKEQVSLALPILDKIIADREIAASWKDEAIAVIAPKLIEVGESDRGLELAKTTKSADVWLQVVQKLAKSGKISESLQIVESLLENSPKKAEAIADLAVEAAR
jgi:tetratricopeptide (TPR) repeat protein